MEPVLDQFIDHVAGCETCVVVHPLALTLPRGIVQGALDDLPEADYCVDGRALLQSAKAGE